MFTNHRMGSLIEADERMETYKIMLYGVIAALILNVSQYVVIYDKYWPWAQGFPFAWLSMSLGYMIVFFHELGHAIAFWFYGYIALPHFDFQNGGGLTTALTGQLLIINLAVYGLLFSFFRQASGHRAWQTFFIVLGLFHLATAYNDFHQVIYIFAGPLAQPIIAAFLLTRAWFDMAPRGSFERFLNAAFGFGMVFASLLNGWALVHDDVWRLVYFEQKGSHGRGDFNTISQITNLDFTTTVWIWIICSLAAVLLPALCYLFRGITSSALDTGSLPPHK